MHSIDFEAGFEFFPCIFPSVRETRERQPLASSAAVLPAMRPKTAPDMRPPYLADLSVSSAARSSRYD
jgi:hypothetical protein